MPNSKIKIYTLPTCGYCLQLKEYLKSKNLEFEEIDVLANEQMAKEMVEKSGQTSCPVLEYNGQLVVGYRKQVLDKFFG
jgi:glutaredoxin-like YruB-family protein